MAEMAERLLDLEAAATDPASERLDAAILVCERLRPVFSRLAGSSGYASFLSRALSLAKAEAPSVADLHVAADGALQSISKEAAVQTGLAPVSSNAGRILVSHLLGLLVTFIGEPMTMTLLRDAWPGQTFEAKHLRRVVKP